MRKMLKFERGFNLIELMVSVAISMAVLAGVAQMFSVQRNSARAQDASSQLQDTARTVFQLLNESIKQAGFLNLPLTFQGVNNYGINDWFVVAGLNSVNIVDGGLLDVLTVRYQTPAVFNPATGAGGDCNGAAPVIQGTLATPQVVNSYSVDGARNLICTNAAGAQVVIAGGVLQFQIRAGLSANAADDNISGYVDAAALTAASAPLLRAIEVCIVLESDARSGDQSASSNGYLSCNGGAVPAAKDGRFRQTYRQTTVIRNNVLGGV
jgi:prepilin-type N-terminal cleavage/methylation domain-containing protein